MFGSFQIVLLQLSENLPKKSTTNYTTQTVKNAFKKIVKIQFCQKKYGFSSSVKKICCLVLPKENSGLTTFIKQKKVLQSNSRLTSFATKIWVV